VSWDRWAEGTIHRNGRSVRWWINKADYTRAFGCGAEVEGPTRVHTQLCQHRSHRTAAGAYACTLECALAVLREVEA
jgi:hypothetical protein